jgi:hypothetical protein
MVAIYDVTEDAAQKFIKDKLIYFCWSRAEIPSTRKRTITLQTIHSIHFLEERR